MPTDGIPYLVARQMILGCWKHTATPTRFSCSPPPTVSCTHKLTTLYFIQKRNAASECYDFGFNFLYIFLEQLRYFIVILFRS